MLRSVADALFLANLRKIDIIFKMLRQTEARGNVKRHFHVTAAAFLVRGKDFAVQSVIFGFGINFNRLFVRQAFKAELAAKPRHALAVIGQRLQTVPNRPQMRVADVVAVKAFHMPDAAGASGNIRRLGIERLHPFGQNVVKELFGPFHIFKAVAPRNRHGFNFIVAVPNGKARVAAQTFDVVFHFFLDVCEKFRVKERIRLAGKAKILPQQNAVAVTRGIERVAFIIAAAPNAQHIHVAELHGLQIIFETFLRISCHKAVRRNPVCTFNKQRHTVDKELEILTVLVTFAIERNRPQTDF